MTILRKAGLLSACGLSTVLNAAVEFENGLVPLELARLFSGGTYYRSLPDNFPVPALPPGFDLEVIGSLDSGFTQQIVLRSGRDDMAVFADLRAAYQAEGWIELSLDAARLALCHDALGRLQVQTGSDAQGGFHIRATRSVLPSGTPAGTLTCAQQRELIEEAGNELAPSTWLFELMPVLELPEAATTPGSVPPPSLFGRFVSYGGNGFQMQNDGSFNLAGGTMAALYQHFALQLQEQGWTVDSNAVGEKSAASVWFRTAEQPAGAGGEAEDLPLTGIMTLLFSGTDSYRMLFTLQGGEGIPVPSLGIRGAPIGTSVIVRDPSF